MIALTITIILLLILAGVTISTLSNNGIFERAKEARDKYKNAQNEEEMQIAKYSNEIDSYVSSGRTFSNVNYSTTEQDTGIKWLNGKTIYCKTIDLGVSFAVGKQSWGEISEEKTPSNIDLPIMGRFYFIDTVNSELISDPIQIALRQGKLKYFALDSWSANSNMQVYLYIEYTKTTD